MRRALAPYDDADPPYWKFAFSPKLMCRVDKAHIPLDRLERLHPNTFAKLGDYFSFVFVRNPYARAVSSFAEWCVRMRLKKRLADPRWAKPAFRNYVAALDLKKAHESATWIHACPQHLFTSVRGRPVCAAVGRVERLEGDFAAIAKKIGLDADARVDRHNALAKRTGEPAGEPAPDDPFQGARDWYDRDTAKRVADFYAADFEMFGYPRA